MSGYVLGFEETDRARVASVGGKGAHLGELARIEGVRVPAGFCVTTAAFRRFVAGAPDVGGMLDALARVAADDRAALRARSEAVRRLLEATAVPDDVATAIARALAALGEGSAYAVRSSATAEDTPTASFAGQQDTYLNVVGVASVVAHVRRCWASLFTERAVAYRARNGFDHRKVAMAVVVQRMVSPQASGVAFTADPVTSNRRVVSIEAVLGLGEPLVSGLVRPDVYKVRGTSLVEKTIASKGTALRAEPAGGTRGEEVAAGLREEPALTDEQVVRLAGLCRAIEAHFGAPQDVEWCLAEGEFHFVQSRPITTLYPVPAAGGEGSRVFVSVGHGQMMTDAMRPLGLSLFQRTAGAPMVEAGGRLFVDVTRALSSPASRQGLLDLFGKSDPLLRDALQTVVDRGDFLPTPPDAAPAAPKGGAMAPTELDPAVVDRLIARSRDSLAATQRDIAARSGAALIDFILDDIRELKRLLSDPENHRAVMAAMESTWWLNEKLAAWLGERGAADALALSASNNVTSEMGLALLDVADAVRPHPEVVAFLQRVTDDAFLDELPALAGGREVRDAITAWLDVYGARGAGEIDVTRPRWSEHPAALVPLLLANVRNFAAGEGPRRFARGLEEAQRKERELLTRLRALPDGAAKADETKRVIDRLRAFIGYREYPKFAMIRRYFVYKRALLGEADRLVRERVLRAREDVFDLTLDELREVVRTRRVDEALLRQRREAFRWYQTLTPPRVITSEGEALTGAYRRGDAPAGALVGLAVSAGVAEGRARVVRDVADADLDAGDVLVTAGTDPSWTPALVAIKALVTEAGGLMTHGSVIAREYGLPAVVGVVDATRRIRDGQRVRVNGTDGYVELLD